MGRPQASGIERGERCARYRGGMPRTLAVLTLACLLPSCGGEDRAGPPAPPPSPAETLLHALGGRVASGRGSSDASWAGDVNAVAMALWPIDGANPDPTALERHRLHANLSHVAGDVARQLAAAPGAREDLAAVEERIAGLARADLVQEVLEAEDPRAEAVRGDRRRAQ